jgi:putative peptidoglycan lipid II flippase
MCLNLGLAIPSTLGLLALSQALVSSLYYSGEFLWSDVLSSQQCLILYAIGLPFFCGLRGVLPLFFAARDTRTPAIAGLLALGVNFICASQLAPRMGAGGIALATSISSFANFVVLLMICIYRFPEFRWGQVLRESLKILMASFLMGALLFLPNNLWLDSIWALPGIRLEKISTLLALVFLGGALYFIFARLFKLREIETLSQQLLSRWRRRQNRH